jgi:hypothetical protein
MQIPTDSIWSLFMRASRDGSIALAAGTLANEADPNTSQGVAVVVRLRADGTPDESFGSSGVQRLYEKGGLVADVLVDPELGTVLVVDPYDA